MKYELEKNEMELLYHFARETNLFYLSQKFKDKFDKDTIEELDLLFAKDEQDWNDNIKQLTYFTNERFLPKLLVEVGAVKSISEVRRNKPQLMVELNEVDFITVKWGKRILNIAIGE